MTVPVAPQEGGGDKILFVVYDNGGANQAALLRAYKKEILNYEPVADIGVYPTSGSLVNGNRNAVDTNQLVLTDASIPCQGVLVKAREDNANDVWIGRDGALTADTTEGTGGWRLQPGASVRVPCRNANEVYIRWATYTAGDGVEWLASAD
jgi:hypothetical protein